MPNNAQRREQAKRKLERQITRRVERDKRRRVVAVISTAVVVLLVAGGVYFLATYDFGSDTTDTAASSSAAPQSDKPASIPTELHAAIKRPTPLAPQVSCEYAAEGESAKPGAKAPENGQVSSEGTVAATLGTSIGDLKLTLDRSLAPCTVNSFVSLVKQGYFNDTTCHRLTTQGIQVLQCGDPTGTGTGGPGYKFNDEVFPEITYGRGVLAMANSGPNTNGSQFFIVYGDASSLPASYTVFGTVDADGLKLVDEVANAGTDSGAGDGKPNTPVDIKTATTA
ncbi:peptidylprolyl isomerase [Actinosynnema pretiosum subsp. pretiosum]|uniref:Peptidyl-prolyl cis-trans isomerase n=2 Tax=Actinosynnema TaxID=40566 RepID=C6WCN1_ACTMD|nr:peptidylprolyl isomerase [Actinosynnema mirum]ACU35648.1 peptidyl-prolyl cis-trans isomerase cyclophilin type [Actinosynnema mirum DSM 43827]AXX29078.1 putative peptidyl-prolyl cis-trans isomerase B [Actinosynnema pretiosum subsp. pretiosum]QUF06647.1 peptidylprolyl isomerase [Actinosynnema pretiosum subsp. pretiosum]